MLSASACFSKYIPLLFVSLLLYIIYTGLSVPVKYAICCSVNIFHLLWYLHIVQEAYSFCGINLSLVIAVLQGIRLVTLSQPFHE